MLPGGLGVIQGLYPALVVYAVAYAALPVGREVLRRRANAKVDERNAAREKWRDALAAGGGRTARRLQAARAQAVAQRKVIGAESVVFDSAKELVDQPVDQSTPLERKFAALEAEAEAAARAAAAEAAAAAERAAALPVDEAVDAAAAAAAERARLLSED